jgi:DNA-binding transcriptional LysR family regulator
MGRLSAMQAAVRVVETGSFSAAAGVLKVGKPAISKTVAQLEARLGVRPFSWLGYSGHQGGRVISEGR